MARALSGDDIRTLGFDWPRYALIGEYCVVVDGCVDLSKTIKRMTSSQAYYQGQLDDAFAFKTRYGADYSDFTDRFDDNARIVRELGVAIAYLEELAEAVKASCA